MKRVSVAARGAANRLKETMNEMDKPVKCEYHDFSDVEYVVMDRHEWKRVGCYRGCIPGGFNVVNLFCCCIFGELEIEYPCCAPWRRTLILEGDRQLTLQDGACSSCCSNRTEILMKDVKEVKMDGDKIVAILGDGACAFLRGLTKLQGEQGPVIAHRSDIEAQGNGNTDEIFTQIKADVAERAQQARTRN